MDFIPLTIEIGSSRLRGSIQHSNVQVQNFYILKTIGEKNVCMCIHVCAKRLAERGDVGRGSYWSHLSTKTEELDCLTMKPKPKEAEPNDSMSLNPDFNIWGPGSSWTWASYTPGTLHICLYFGHWVKPVWVFSSLPPTVSWLVYFLFIKLKWLLPWRYQEGKYILAVKLAIGGSKFSRRVSRARHLFDSDADPGTASIKSTAIQDGPFKPHQFLKIYDTKGWAVTFFYIQVKCLDDWLSKVIMEKKPKVLGI